MKSSPDIFLEASRRIGLEPGACLVIEDAVSGVAAAKAAGARCPGIATTLEADRLIATGNWTAANLAAASEPSGVGPRSRT